MYWLTKLSLAALCLVACGCSSGEVSKSPLSAPDEAQLDPRFLGTWHNDNLPGYLDNVGADYLVHISAAGPGFPKGMMRLLVVRQPHSRRRTSDHHEFLGFVSMVDDRQYFNLMLNASEPIESTAYGFENMKEWDPDCPVGYLLFEVRHSDTTFKLRGMNFGILESCIEAGDVRGQITRDTNGQARGLELTASTEELAEFVSENRTALFDTADPRLRFVRLKRLKKGPEDDLRTPERNRLMPEQPDRTQLHEEDNQDGLKPQRTHGGLI